MSIFSHRLIDPLRAEALSPTNIALFNAARSRHETLASYPSIASVLDALRDTREETYPQRSALIRALVTEQHNRPHSFWAATLLLAFYPMLRRLHRQIGENVVPYDELEQMIITSFLSIIAECTLETVPDRIAVWLKHQTRRRVFKKLYRIQLSYKTEKPLDTDYAAHVEGCGWPEFKTEIHQDLYNPKDATRAVLALLEYGGELLDAECFDLVIATAYCRRSLTYYVSKIGTGLDFDSTNRVYGRVRQRHRRAMSRLRTAMSRSRCPRTTDDNIVYYANDSLLKEQWT